MSPLARAEFADDSYVRELGERVLHERLARGMTQALLARDARISVRRLREVEAGLANPTLLLVRRIARALDLDPADLLP